MANRINLKEMRYNDDFIVANRLVTYEQELATLKEKLKTPKVYPNAVIRAEYLQRLISNDRSLLSERVRT